MAGPLTGLDQQRLQALARDYEGQGGGITPGSLREAQIALTLEAQGRVPAPVDRRPDHHGDFIDGAGVEWDVKAPMSRSAIHAKIRRDAQRAGRAPPPLDAHRRIAGEFDLAELLPTIQAQILGGEGVIIDTTHLEQADEAALRAAIAADPRLAGVIFFP